MKQPNTQQPLSSDELDHLNAWWRAANYLSAGMIYLHDNPLLREPLRPEHIKQRLLGHWGSDPGQSFLWVHLNRVIRKYDLDMIYISGPGHGAPATLSNAYLDGSYTEIYPDKSQDGPVGLLAAHSAILRGAADVYVVDRVKERLDTARELGAIPVNFAEGDPVEQIRALRKNNQAHMESLRPGEAEKLTGVDCVIDAVGYQAHDAKNPGKEKPTQVIDYAAKLVNAAGNIALIGVYMSPDPGAKDEQAKQGIYPLPIGELFDSAVTIGMGQCPVKRYNEYLRDLIIQGKAHPGKIVSHHIKIEKAPEAYEKFDKRADGYTKVLIRFDEAMAA